MRSWQQHSQRLVVHVDTIGWAAQVLKMTSGLRVAAMLPVAEFREEDYVLMLTRKGMLKKMAMSHFAKIPARGSTAIGLNVRSAQLWRRGVMLCNAIPRPHWTG